MDFRKNSKYILLGIIILGVFLRLLYFDSLTFGYDQARDALQSMEIIKNKDVKIIGPTTDIKGLFHSPLYWYIISPFYYFSNGNPEIARIPIIFIGLLNVLFIYFLAKKLFHDEKIALLSSFFMTVSFEAVQYSRWLSNPSPALLTVAVFFYGFWLALKRKKIGLPLMIFFWSLSVDFQFFLVYQILFVIFAFFYLLVKDKKILYQSIKSYYWLYLSSLIFFSFYILAEIKFKFQGLKALLNFLVQPKDAGMPILPKLMNFLNNLMINISVNITAESIIPAKIFLLFLVVCISYFLFKRYRQRKLIVFLSIWLISPIIIYPFEKNNSYFLNIGNLYPLILLTTFLINEFSKRRKHINTIFFVCCIGVILSANLYLLLDENKKGETLFSAQYDQIYRDEKAIIDYTYASSNYKMFAINTLTNPLYINTTWAYLYNMYGKTKYGYMPVWLGAYLDDFGKEIEFSAVTKIKKGDFLYLIIEPPVFHEDYIKAYSKYENSRTELSGKKQIGSHIIENRRLTEVKLFSRDDLTGFLQK